MSSKLYHATAVAINGEGVLIIGPSGSGKSDLALRLIDRGAVLISDDAVLVEAEHLPPRLKAAPNIEGKLEVRQIGIVGLNYLRAASLHMVIELTDQGDRMPADKLTFNIGRHQIPMFQLNPFETSAPLKVEYALRYLTGRDGSILENESAEKIDP